MEMKLILEIAEDKKLELTEPEAKALYLKLNELFANKVCTYPYWYNTQSITYRNTVDDTNSYTVPEEYIKIRMY